MGKPERPMEWRILALSLFLVAFSWAYFSTSYRDLMMLEPEVFPFGYAEIDDPENPIGLSGVYVAHPWISLALGLLWGGVLGLFEKLRIGTHMDSRVNAFWLEAHGQPIRAFRARFPNEWEIWATALLPVPLILLVPLAAIPFFFGGVAVFLTMIYPQERAALLRTNVMLPSDENDGKLHATLSLKPLWLSRARAGATMMVFAIAGAASVLLVYTAIELSSTTGEIHSFKETLVSKASKL